MATHSPSFSFASSSAFRSTVWNRQRRRVCATMASKSLGGKSVLVTGAGQGIGRGIAIGFAELGAKVYATGRAESSLSETISLVQAVGGECVPLICDHSDDSAVERLWRDLGHVDIVVNNAYSAVEFLKSSGGIPSWKKCAENPKAPATDSSHPGRVWDAINNVGLRNNFICSSYALRKFAAQGGHGILVNVSSFGGLVSIFDAAYCIGKSGIDRMSAELAKEAPEGVMCFAFYPGLVSTPRLKELLEGPKKQFDSWNSESPLFVGRSLAGGIAHQKGKLVRSMHGRIVIAAEIGRKVGAKDENGYCPISMRSLRFAFSQAIPGLVGSPLLNLIPNIYIPLPVLLALAGPVKVW